MTPDKVITAVKEALGNPTSGVIAENLGGIEAAIRQAFSKDDGASKKTGAHKKNEAPLGDGDDTPALDAAPAAITRILKANETR